MILMLIKADQTLGDKLDQHLQPYGVNVVQYTSPLKALDNLAEVNPQIILFDYVDFPRHWKIIIRYLRQDFNRQDKVFLLLAASPIPLEEANKALFLGVNGILNYAGDVQKLGQSIREIFLRYGTFPLEENNSFMGDKKTIGFVFRHPRKKNLVTGTLLHLEENWAAFRPDYKHETVDLEEGDDLIGASLRIGESLLFINAKVKSNTGQLHLMLLPATAKDKLQLHEKLSILR